MSAAKIPHRRPIRSGNNSTVGEKTAERIHAIIARIFGGRRVINIVAIFAGVVIIVGGLLWFNAIYRNPEHVFWGMVNNNLSTYSVTKSTTQAINGSNTKETTELSFTSKPLVHDVKEVSALTSTGTSRIKIESVGTPKDTYQRYFLIDQPASPGKTKPDYSKIYSMWLKNGGNVQVSNSQLFNNAVFSAFLFGNLSPQQRSEAVDYLKDAYSVDFDKVEKNGSFGHRTYTYTVVLSLRDYAEAAKAYANSLGLPNASQIDPSNYKPTDKLSLSVSVDVLSRQLRELVYKSNSAKETYASYGALTSFSAPKHTVTYQTLQQAVTKAASQ